MMSNPADAVNAHWFEALPPRLKPWAQLMRLDRPIGIWLLFWPCVLGLVLGAIVVASLGHQRRKERWSVLGMIVFAGFLAAAALVPMRLDPA